MVTTKRRSPTSTLVSKSAISQASTILEDLPEKPKEIWSLREAIELLKDPITAALDRGYSYPEVSKMLSERGVEISASTLKYYLSAARKEKDPTKPRTRRQRRNLGGTATANGSVNGVTEAIDDLTSDDDETPTAKPRGRKAATAATEPAAKPARKATSRRSTAKAKTEPETSAEPKTRVSSTRAKAAPKAPSTRGRKKPI
jgi:hypothetical protein